MPAALFLYSFLVLRSFALGRRVCCFILFIYLFFRERAAPFLRSRSFIRLLIRVLFGVSFFFYSVSIVARRRKNRKRTKVLGCSRAVLPRAPTPPRRSAVTTALKKIKSKTVLAVRT